TAPSCSRTARTPARCRDTCCAGPELRPAARRACGRASCRRRSLAQLLLEPRRVRVHRALEAPDRGLEARHRLLRLRRGLLRARRRRLGAREILAAAIGQDEAHAEPGEVLLAVEPADPPRRRPAKLVARLE